MRILQRNPIYPLPRLTNYYFSMFALSFSISVCVSPSRPIFPPLLPQSLPLSSTFSSSFLNYLRVTCRHHAPLSVNTSVYVFLKWCQSLTNFSTCVKIEISHCFNFLFHKPLLSRLYTYTHWKRNVFGRTCISNG